MEINQKHAENLDLLLSEFNKLGETRSAAVDSVLRKRFLELVLEHFPLEDWFGRPISDLYCACAGFLNFLSKRQPDEQLVSVFNPTLETDGWLCHRSIVMFCCKDSPFLVDTVRMVLEDREYAIHVSKSTVLDVIRDSKGEVTSINSVGEASACAETFAYFEITAIASEKERANLAKRVQESLRHVDVVVSDYAQMLARVDEISNALESKADNTETLDFLKWLRSSHFTFLGFREFDFDKPQSSGSLSSRSVLKEDMSKRLGTFRAINSKALNLPVSAFPIGSVDFYQSRETVCFSKAGTRSTVHRSVYPDYVVLKKYDADSKVVGEIRFLGFFTYAVSSMSPSDIPILRGKVENIRKHFGLNDRSHDGKRLTRAIDLHPKEEFFQASSEDLRAALTKVVDLNERDIVRFIVRKDPFGQFVSCFVYVPRDLYTTDLRIKIQSLIAHEIGAESADVTTFFSESKHARAHMIFRIDENKPYKGDLQLLEPEIIELANGWLENFRKALDERYGESKGTAKYKQYCMAFPQSYQEQFESRSAVGDIETFESLSDAKGIAMRLYRPIESPKNEIRFRVAHLDQMLELSDVIPILEDLGLRVLGEQPFKIKCRDGRLYWLHDFQLTSTYSEELNVKDLGKYFEEAFAAIWRKSAESDNFNTLILVAGLNWQEVNLLRAYANYMKQTLFQLSLEYIAETLISYPSLCEQLVKLFSTKFNPSTHEDASTRLKKAEKLGAKIISALDDIKTLNQDKVIRRYIELINGTLRTNFYQMMLLPDHKGYISLKLNAESIKDIPEPRPAFEFFVYSSRVEGVHLRTSKVARGGLRWSDRQEDYRTEVLGLVKAQQVKNAVIVPSGAKGGFVAKQIPFQATRAEFLAEGVECYKIFIRGLLDLTDNLIAGETTRPEHVVCLDDEDPYLVVAADKGTATFSDIANEISIAKGHWLGDAFASGGSQGYDHKGMGITAKGAWVSVQQHFRELGLNTQEDEFTVIGIGDMAGDVFGNGMLLSRTIKLVAAFNHLHIFIDPSPSSEKSFNERQRLFNTPGASWADYRSDLISEGGGIFSRSSKFIELSSEMQALVGTRRSKVTPTELINLLLKAPVDLIWNGGIGTYVKSTSEQHADVGDKANDNLRVNGEDLKCRVFGEGGNLGMTQLGRVEFALNGGACNTDFIDNAAGVDCSDHEVNIKILIDECCKSGDLTEKQRNQLLVDMTDAVSDLVLRNNYSQTLALSVAEQKVLERTNEYRRFIDYLVHAGRLDRALEFLPEDSDLVDRLGNGASLCRPELSVLISYAKVQLKEELAISDIAEDKYCALSLFDVFPQQLLDKYKVEIGEHKLRREIIATQLANDFINSLGITALHRLTETTGANSEEIVKAYVAARDVFDLPRFVNFISSLDYKLNSSAQYDLLASMSRRVRRGARWFLKNRRSGLQVESEVSNFKEPLKKVQSAIGSVAKNEELDKREELVAQLKDIGISDEWVDMLVMPENMFSGLGVIEVANLSKVSVEDAAEMFIELMRVLKLDWFATQLAEIKVETYWQANAREAYIDDLEAQLRKLSVLLLSERRENREVQVIVNEWMEANTHLVSRWTTMVNKVESISQTDYAMFSVALRELNDLVQVTVHQ